MIKGEEYLIGNQSGISGQPADSDGSNISRKQLLYFYHHKLSFVRKDTAIMQTAFKVKTFLLNADNRLYTLAGMLRQLFFILKHTPSSSVMVVQFAGFISFLPALLGRLLRIPVLIIAGGTDSVSFPSISYGNFSSPILAFFTSMSYRLASHIAPVSESLAFFEDNYNYTDSKYQGFNYHCKNLKTPYTVIENGYSGDFWHNTGCGKIPSSFVTLTSGFGSRFFYQLKGFDLFISAAIDMPDSLFTIVGIPEDYKFENQPPNIKCIPYCTPVELREIYSKHEFFLQLSMSEGFPNAISEAMLCECIPIGSNVAALPRIIGNTGYILQRRDKELLKVLLKEANEADKEKLSKQARNRILTSFTLKRREEELISLINKLTDKNMS